MDAGGTGRRRSVRLLRHVRPLPEPSLESLQALECDRGDDERRFCRVCPRSGQKLVPVAGGNQL